VKILLVTRGSQGDIYPYLALAKSLMRNGHMVTMSLPEMFEEYAKGFDIPYTLQTKDDIVDMVGTANNVSDLIAWTKRVIDTQFQELIPLLEQNDVFVSSNTEFAAPSIAEYCSKPFIRTCYAPLIPGNKIPPPLTPWQKPILFAPPALQWKVLNIGLNLMVKKTLNVQRKARGMTLIKDQGEYAPTMAYNYLMYSPTLGGVDPNWRYRWSIGGYCFNDDLPYDEVVYHKLMDFIKQDDHPTLFFTLGSCHAKNGDQFCETLFNICEKHNYKLVVGAGWWKTGTRLQGKKNLFVLDTTIPHRLIFPVCTAILHHGGSGTSHNAARSGIPQGMVPLLIDQYYWGYCASQLRLGPESVNIAKIKADALEEKVVDLMTNPLYKENALVIGEKIRNENGVAALSDFIGELDKRAYVASEHNKRYDAKIKNVIG
jgi:UDP:flavonoid glycosyltransferase YjiC (YdhE family)